MDKMKNPTSGLQFVLMIVLGIWAVALSLPYIFNALTNLSQVSGLSFASFFTSGGVVYLAISIGIIASLLAWFIGSHRK